MKGKSFLITLSGIAALIAAVIFYLLLYLMPTVKSISRSKRYVKDMKLEISDFLEMEDAFLFPDELENRYFAKSKRELKHKIPEVKNKEEIIALFAKMSGYIENLAKKDGIIDPELTTMSEPGGVSPLSTLLPGVRCQSVLLRFTGKLNDAMNFINHLPWGNDYVSAGKLSITAGDDFPGYTILLRVFYLDLSLENEESKAVVSKSDRGLNIDYNSEILLRPVYRGLLKKRAKKELPPRFGEKKFFNNR